MKHQNVSKVINCIDRWNRVRQFSYPVQQILTQIFSPFPKYQHFFEQRKMKIILMKGEVRVSGQNDHSPPSNPSISQILTGVNDDIYRLFIDPLSES